MPSVSGLDVLRQVRTVDPDLPFVMVTAVAAQYAAIEARVTGDIVKPYSQDQLAKILTPIERMLNLRKGPVETRY